MKLNYDMSDDEIDDLQQLNVSDLDELLSGEELQQPQEQMKQAQSHKVQHSKKEEWIVKKQNKSEKHHHPNYQVQNVGYTDIPKDSLEEDAFEQKDFQIDDLIGTRNENNRGGGNAGKRYVPPTVDSSYSNLNYNKGPKIFKGEGKQFGNKEKIQLAPPPILEMKNADILNRQHSFQAENHTVYFPFAPYQCQKDFMGKVIKALNQNENALLESPTGTGKTLSLLCASLAWLQGFRERAMIDKSIPFVPRIIYTSRTHSQLAQVQKELRNTAYNPRSVIIGSRDHLCVHPEIKLLRGHALNMACKKAQKSIDPCGYGKNRDQAIKMLKWEPYDIEELHHLAMDMTFCPYFASKDRVAGADIVFMPYNYLIDAKIRENFEITYKGAVIIFDEAHNVSGCAEDVASFEVVGKVLEQTEIELMKLQDEKRIQEDTINFKSSDEEVSNLHQMTRQFHRYLEDFDMDQRNVQNFRIDAQYLKEGSVVMPGKEIFEIFRKGTQIDYLDRVNQEQKASNIFADWQKWSQAFENVLNDITTLQQYSVKTSIEVWFDILKKITRLKFKQQAAPTKSITKSQDPINAEVANTNQDVDDFYVYIFDEEDNSNNQLQFNVKKKKSSGVFVQNQYQRTLAFWCFNAGISFREIQELEPRSIILTSGTLSPLTSFQAELQLQFNQRLENPHVISPDQVSINILSRGVRDSNFNFSFQNRDNENAIIDLGMTIANIASMTPGGMLIFYPSYRVLQKCEEIWNQNNVRNAIEKQKKLFMEPKDSSKYQSTMDAFYKAIFNPKKNEKTNGAILMGVCRGRISEGLDFSDNAARCVIVVGIPYPQLTDPRVVLKKDYLDKRISTSRMNGAMPEFQNLSGKDWYAQQATRAVNQAIGRVIRHVQDYGSIILIDERYNWGSMRSAISKWLRDRIKFYNKYQEMQSVLGGFYGQMANKGFKAKVEQLAQIQLDMDGDSGLNKGKIQSSQEEEAKGGLGFMNQIGKNKLNNQDQDKNKKGTSAIARLFDKSKDVVNKNQKRTLGDIKGFDEKQPKPKMKFTSDDVVKNAEEEANEQPPKKKNGFGFIDDDEEILDILEKNNFKKQNTHQPQIQVQEQNFGLGKGLQIRDSKKRPDQLLANYLNSNKLAKQLDEFSYKGTKKTNQSYTTRVDDKQKSTDTPLNESINSSSGSILNDSNFSMIQQQQLRPKNNGIYSSTVNITAKDDNKAKFNFLISGFKKFMTDQQLQQVVKLIPKLKDVNEMPIVFGSIKDNLFSFKKDLKIDRNYTDKLALLESLGSFLSADKQDQFNGLLQNIK